MTDIKAILFDSGKVLNSPATGNWFLPPDFFQYVDREKFERIPLWRRKRAFCNAGKILDSQLSVQTLDQEVPLFQAYYRAFFRTLPELYISEADRGKIAENLVYCPNKYRFYPDALEVLHQLKDTYRLAVVSDAWPSLANVFEEAGLKNYFSSFVISSVLGTSKPDPVMYRTSLEELGIEASKAIFIDDSVKNCIGAKKLGIHPVLLCRDKTKAAMLRVAGSAIGLKVISNLYQVPNIIKE